jgi:hypothetical protein
MAVTEGQVPECLHDVLNWAATKKGAFDFQNTSNVRLTHRLQSLHGWLAPPEATELGWPLGRRR